jgi:hypothetical protein
MVLRGFHSGPEAALETVTLFFPQLTPGSLPLEGADVSLPDLDVHSIITILIGIPLLSELGT